MKLRHLLRSIPVLAGLVLLFAPVASADDHAEAAAKHPDYPLTTCVVSDEGLYDMGEPVEYVHREAGKPDRLILFCCNHCVKDFKKDPATYLKKLDEAALAAAKARSAKP